MGLSRKARQCLKNLLSVAMSGQDLPCFWLEWCINEMKQGVVCVMLFGALSWCWVLSDWSYSLEQIDRTVAAKLAAQMRKSIRRSGKWKETAYVFQLEVCPCFINEEVSYGGGVDQESFTMVSTIIGEFKAVASELLMNHVGRMSELSRLKTVSSDLT